MGTWDYDLIADVCHFDARAQDMYNLPSDQLDHRPAGVASVVHPDDVGPMFDEIQRATDVEGEGRYDIVYRIAQADGKYRWVRACGIAESEGIGKARRAVRIVGASRDITREREAEIALREGERHANLLLAELQHRVRNTLAAVRSIARRTAENSKSAEEMLAHFQGRLDAFSRVQAALTRSADAKVDLASLINDEVVAHAAREGEQVTIKGPQIALAPKLAERLSLALHELTTNAVKHGALASPSGRIGISWTKERANGSSELFLKWKESGLNLEEREIRREGFGMELLKRSLPYELQAETAVKLNREGLTFELRMPLAADEAP